MSEQKTGWFISPEQLGLHFLHEANRRQSSAVSIAAEKCKPNSERDGSNPL